MNRAFPLLVMSLASAALVVLPSTAHAEPPMCRGSAATIVGTPGGGAIGTDGPDVIVSNDATLVDGLGGDDLICVTGAAVVYVDADDGDDVVDTTAASDYHAVELGEGADTFHGGGGEDRVNAAADDGIDTADTVDTGAGDDHVTTGTGGVANDDEIRLGAGADRLRLDGRPGDGGLDSGAGTDTVELLQDDVDQWEIDSRRGTLAADGRLGRLAGFERFYAAEGARWGALRFRGGPANEILDLTRWTVGSPIGRIEAHLGAGRDTFVTNLGGAGPTSGGKGADLLVVRRRALPGITRGRVVVDLVKDHVLGGGPWGLSALSFENVGAQRFARVTVVGDAAGNDIHVSTACTSVVRSGAGGDTVRFTFPAGARACSSTVQERRIRARGGPGDDQLRGWGGDDVLLGGPGRDLAWGGGGRDRCATEVRLRCELR